MNPGETREGVRVVLAKNQHGRWEELAPILKSLAKNETRTFYSQDLLTDLAEQLEARAEDARGTYDATLEGIDLGRADAYEAAAQLLRSLIEHGPDDGRAESFAKQVSERAGLKKGGPAESDDGGSEPKRRVCPFCGKCPKCCGEGWLADPFNDEGKIPCPDPWHGKR